MVFHHQLEVGEGYGDERCDDDKQYKSNKQYTEQRVNLMPPHGSEDVMQLDVDG